MNAGSNKDTKSYSPDWLAKVFKWGLFWPIGFIRLPQGYGISVGAQFSNEEIKSSEKLVKRLIKTSGFFWRAKRIALNGVIPSAASKYDVWPDDERYVETQYGTLFMISENIRQVKEIHPELADKPIGVVGCGFTGSHLVEYLETDDELKIYAFDNFRKNLSYDHADFVGADYSKISECGIVVLLTTLGNDGMASVISHLQPGTAIVSDTHPKVTTSYWRMAEEKGCHAYESGTSLDGVRFFPSFPRWNNTTVPGCVVQAITESFHNKTIDEQELFNQLAKEAGFVARLDEPEMLS